MKTKTKYLLAIATFMLFGATSLQAQKCKWDVNETDGFSGKKHLLTKKELVNQDNHKVGQAQSYATVSFELKEGVIIFNAKHHIGGPALGVDKINTPTLSLRPAKGEIIMIKSSKAFPTQLFIGATEVDFHFELTKDQLVNLESGLTAFRLSFLEKDSDFTLSSKETEKLMKQVSCLLGEM